MAMPSTLRWLLLLPLRPLLLRFMFAMPANLVTAKVTFTSSMFATMRMSHLIIVLAGYRRGTYDVSEPHGSRASPYTHCDACQPTSMSTANDAAPHHYDSERFYGHGSAVLIMMIRKMQRGSRLRLLGMMTYGSFLNENYYCDSGDLH